MLSGHFVLHGPGCEKTCLRGFRPGTTLNGPQKMPRGLKFRIYEVEGVYYQCSENKSTDQLRRYLFFRVCQQKASFLMTWFTLN